MAARPGQEQTGKITINGCADHDVYLQSVDQVPATVGIVRRLRVIMDLHDRAATDGVGAQPQDPGGGLVIWLRERAFVS